MMWFFLIAGLVGITISCQSYFPQENDDNAKNRISGVEGTVIAESDVMFESDMVMTDQLVLIFPQEATSSLVGRKVDSSELRFLRETISELNEGIETTSVLEPSTIVAIIVYAVVAWGVVMLIRIMSRERQVA